MDNPSPTLRPATFEDWAAIQALLAEAGLPPDGAVEHLAQFVVALDGDRVIAAGGMENYGTVGLLRSVVVAPAFRARGVAKALVQAIHEQARSAGIHQLVLLTTNARAYFERLGFKLIERAAMPEAVRASSQLKGACPATASVMSRSLLPVAVIGAGPVGLAAAAHLLERGLQPLILEAGPSVGSHLETCAHVRLFSPWQYNIDPAAGRLLDSAGWVRPQPDALPTARALIDEYLVPLAHIGPMAQALRLEHRVTAVTRAGFDKLTSQGRAAAPFVLHATHGGRDSSFLASAIIDATGTWGNPNPLGANGVPADGESAHRDRIAYGMPDVLGAARARYSGRTVMVAGSGHSAGGTLLALAQLADEAPGTQIIWAVRGQGLARMAGGAQDGLPARGALGERLRQLVDSGRVTLRTRFRVAAVEASGHGLRVLGQRQGEVIDHIDQIIVAAGSRPNLQLTRELRVRHDPWIESTDALAPLIDPNEHSCGTVRPHGHRELAHPEPGYYAIGAKSYGRAPNFLLATGYEQARSVVAALAGDLTSADAVQLDLPHTGVCRVASGPGAHASPAAAGTLSESPTSSCCGESVPAVSSVTVPAPKHAAQAAAGCCGGPAPAGADACCVLDLERKTEGATGCGCA